MCRSVLLPLTEDLLAEIPHYGPECSDATKFGAKLTQSMLDAVSEGSVETVMKELQMPGSDGQRRRAPEVKGAEATPVQSLLLAGATPFEYATCVAIICTFIMMLWLCQ